MVDLDAIRRVKAQSDATSLPIQGSVVFEERTMVMNVSLIDKSHCVRHLDFCTRVTIGG